VLMPFLLERERYFLYGMALIGTILIASQFNIWFFNYFIDYLFPDYYFISYHSRAALILIFSIFLVGTTLIKLAEDWVFFNRNQNRALREKNEQIRNQLSALRAQINPHFLFNSLNVIYSLALDKNERTTDAIVQLSDVLRYIIYDSDARQVSLKYEITLLKNYIDFQKYRKREAEKVRFTTGVENEDYPIYPMLLLPLVENSFKHGTKDPSHDTFIEITLTQKGEEFTFIIENHCQEGSGNGGLLPAGVGLANIRNNLEIVYPGAHDFEIQKNGSTFKVTLKLYKKCALPASS
jgi:LytS/YehU family sensor histidine kinase